MKNKTKILTIIIILAIAFVIVLLSIEFNKSATFKIGYLGPETGPVAYTGEPVKNGFELAHFNSENENIEVIYEDDKCNTEEAVKAAKKLIEVDRVQILVSGVCSNSVLGIAPIARENNVVLLSAAAASPAITNAGDNVFRVSSSSSLMAPEAAKKVKEMGYNQIGIIYEMNDYPLGWKDSFKQEFEKLGGQILIEEGFNSGSMDLKAQLTKIQNKNPDLILMSALSAPSAIQILKQAEELGINTQLLGNEVFSFKSVIQNKESSEGILVTTYNYNIDSSEMKNFLEDYKIKYDKNATEEIYGALGYDLFNLINSAIKDCNSDNPECIKDYLNNGKSIQGISGAFSLDKNGDAVRSFVLRRVNEGQLN